MRVPWTDNQNTTRDTFMRLALGHGLYRFRFIIDGREGVLIRVPLLGKVWLCGPGFSGRMGWTGVRAEHALGLTD